MQENKIIFDVGIIGAGPAGMTAAIYAGRANKSVLLIDKGCIGGNIATSPKVENIPGFDVISGMEFAEKMFDQTMKYNVTFEIEEVTGIESDDIITINTAENLYQCKTLIIATGTKPKELNFKTNNLHYCVTCDGPFYRDKRVAVIGSGKTGASFALELANYCSHVAVYEMAQDIQCEKVSKDLMLSNPKIKIFTGEHITEVNNDENNNLISVNTEMITKEGDRVEYKNVYYDAIFSAIGMIPQAEFAKNITLQNNGYIISDESCKTTFKNIFVAGDCRDKAIRQVTTAVNDGTITAINAIEYLKDNN